jgi:hypothetical protein
LQILLALLSFSGVALPQIVALHAVDRGGLLHLRLVAFRSFHEVGTFGCIAEDGLLARPWGCDCVGLPLPRMRMLCVCERKGMVRAIHALATQEMPQLWAGSSGAIRPLGCRDRTGRFQQTKTLAPTDMNDRSWSAADTALLGPEWRLSDARSENPPFRMRPNCRRCADESGEIAQAL